MELAAEMAETIVHKVDSSMLLVQELSGGKHLGRELAALKDAIRSFRAKLVDSQVSATMSHDTVGIQDWLKKVRTALYDIDDLVDRIYGAAAAIHGGKIGARRRNSSLFHCFWDLSLNYRWSAREIRDMREKLKHVADNHARNGLSDLELRRENEKTQASLSAAPLVGRSSDRNAILRMLQQQSHPFSAIVIYGMAGLGKTTVAQLVYNYSRIPGFDQRFWVWVGNELNPCSIVSRISEAMTSKIRTEQSNATLEDAVRGKKLLLFLDDVRSLNQETLVSIRDWPILAGSSTMMVITTRFEQVATVNNWQIPTTLHALGGISDEDVWNLFKKKAFNNDEDPELLDLGWEMLKRTNNVPRTIRDLASLLNGEDKRKWKALMNADFSRLREGYSPFPSGSSLAFRLLPSPLKRCFAYSALFQQNDNIEMRQLIHLWIAQGYIEEQVLDDENQSLEEVAEDYYTALRDWSFLKDHDSDFDLAKSVAASEMLAVNFICAQDGSVLDIEPYDCNGIYHLFLSSTSSLSNAGSVPSPGNSSLLLKDLIISLPPQLRSLLKARGSTVRLTTSICDRLFSSLGHLRALDLNSSNITKVPASIGLLEHLRYLNLSLNDFTKLPESITTLAKLQVFDLCSCKKLEILPTHFCELSSLRHLYLDGCESLTGMPVGLRKMTALQTLNLFVLGKTQKSCKLDELSKLNLKSELTYAFASQL